MANQSQKKKPGWTRWMPIVRSTTSGKILFVCLVCGKLTPAPYYCLIVEQGHVDPRLAQMFPGVRECDEIENLINAHSEKNLNQGLYLHWAEDQLRPFEKRHCPHCRGYGCQVCGG